MALSLPLDGATVDQLDPVFELSVYSDNTLTTSLQITVGNNELTPDNIANSGWLTVNVGSSYYRPGRWTIPVGKLNWGTAYYWSARVRDSQSTGPWSPVATFTTVIPSPDSSEHFGNDISELDAAGVNVYAGNLARHATDLSLPTVAAPLEIARSYNSSDSGTGAFGYGWSSPLDMTTSTSTVSSSTIVAVHDGDGQVVRYGRNPDGTWSRGYGPGLSATVKSPQEIVLPDGTDYHFAASSQANKYLLDAITYTNGDVHRFTRDSAGQVTAVADSVSGRGLYLTWSNGHVTTVATDPTSGSDTITWTYDYDGSRLVTVCPPGGGVDSDHRCGHYGYGAQGDAPGARGRLVREFEPDDSVGWGFAYSDDGRTSSVGHGQTGSDNRGWSYEVSTDSDGNRIVFVIDPVGTHVHYQFNDRGSLTYQWTGGDTQTVHNTRSFGYDVFGQQSSVVDENGNSTEYYWSTHGLKATSRFIDNRGTTSITANQYEYPVNDPDDWRWHLVTGVLQGDASHVTSYTYNTRGQQLTATTPPTKAAPGGETTTSAYTCTGNDGPPAAVHNADEAAGTQPCNMLASVTDPAGGVTRYSYDSAGNRTRITLPGGLTKDMYYDRFGRVTRALATTPPSTTAAETVYTYDAGGRVLTETDPKVTNPVTRTAHQLVITNRYDAAGRKTSEVRSDTTPIADGGDVPRRTEFEYDGAGRLATVLHNGVVDSHTYYNGLGGVLARYFHGDSIFYRYDDHARLVGVDHGYPLQRISYDDGGRVASVTDAMGHTVNYAYTIDDLKASESLAYVDPASGAARTIALDSYQYDLRRNLVQDTAGAGTNARTTTYTYDAVNRLLDTTVDPGGLNRTTSIGYDAAGRKSATTLTDGTRTESEGYTYDSAGRIAAQTVDNGGAGSLVTRFGWDGAGHLLATSDPRSDGTTSAYTTTATYDLLGRTSTASTPPVVTASGTPGAAVETRTLVQTLGYDTFGDLTQTRDADGRVTSTSYDDEGQRVGLTYPTLTQPDGSSTAAAEAWTYDERGNVATHTDPVGTVTTYKYDSDDQPTTVTEQPASGGGSPRTTTVAYDHNGNVLSEIDPTGAQTLTTYDGMDRRSSSTRVVRVAGQASVRDTTTYGYDDFGDLTSETSPATGVTATYDHAGELASTTVSGRGTATFGYDVAGRQTSTKDYSGRTTTSGYDLAGRLTSTAITAADGTALRRTTYTIDAAGNRSSTTDPDGNVQTARFDALNRMTTLTDAAPRTADGTQLAAPVTSFDYDAAGKTTRQTDARGNVTYQTYNERELPETRVEPATAAHSTAADRTWATAYDANGRPVTLTEPDGVTVVGTYDGFGDLTGEKGTGGGQDAARNLSYDGDGRLTSESAPGGTQTFSYDDRGQLLGSGGPAGSATYKYDAAGRLASASDGAGSRSFTYNVNTTDVATVSDSLSGLVHTYAYTADGNLKTDSAATSSGPSTVRTVEYDPLGRQASDTTTTAAGAVDVRTAYTWDAADQMLTRTTSGAEVGDPHTDAYTYDADHRLVREVRTAAGASTSTGSDFDYDATGNRTKSTDWTGAVGSHTTARTTSFTYDQRNAITGSTATGSSTQYTDNGRGMLTSRTVAAGGGALVTTTYTSDALGRLRAAGSIGYDYDSLDRLISRSADGAAAGSFSYGGLGLEPVTDGTTSYSRGLDGNLLSTRTGAGSATASLTDAHGDAVAGVDAQTGAVSWNRTYNAFGAVAAARGTAPAAGFQGSWTDPSTGLVHAQARWYDPDTGAFTQPDTAPPAVTDSASTNDRLYGGADPISTSDPSGHFLKFISDGLADLADVVGDIGGDVLVGLEGVADVAACAAACTVLLVGAGVVGLAVGGYYLYDALSSDPTPGGDPAPNVVIPCFGPQCSGGGKHPPAANPPRTKPPTQDPPQPPPPHIVSTKYVPHTKTWKDRSRYWDDKYLYHRVDTYSYTTTYRYDYYSNGIKLYAGWHRTPTKHTVKITRQLLIDLSHPRVTLTERAGKPDIPSVDQQADPGTGGCGSGGSLDTCFAGTQNPLPFGARGSGQGASDSAAPDTDAGGGGAKPPTILGAGADSCEPDPTNQNGSGPSYNQLAGRGAGDAHHIIQNAAVRDIVGYSRGLAPAILLQGPSSLIGTQHYLATQTQREAGGGTYGAERDIAYRALRAAGLTSEDAISGIERSDRYFLGSLCISLDSPTNVPRNRAR